MKYVFFGTPRFATRILERLIETDMQPSALVCNPDRPVGRKRVITPPLTKRLILNKGLNIKILQPESKKELLALSDEIFRDSDLGIVAAYSQIIPQEVIDKARLGIIGVHPSLLPKLRGSSPIQTAILEGHEETGVTLFMLDEKIDHGSVIGKKKFRAREYTYLELEKRLADLAGDMLIETLPRFMIGKIEPEAQDDSQATYTRKFSTEDGYVDPKDLEKAQNGGQNALEILRKIRALNPEPGVYTMLDNKRTKLLDAEIRDNKLVLKEIQKEGGVSTKI